MPRLRGSMHSMERPERASDISMILPVFFVPMSNCINDQWPGTNDQAMKMTKDQEPMTKQYPITNTQYPMVIGYWVLDIDYYYNSGLDDLGVIENNILGILSVPLKKKFL